MPVGIPNYDRNMKSNQNSHFINLFLALMLLSVNLISGQTLYKPVPTANPNYSGSTNWRAACGSADYNEYFVNFKWAPPVVQADNEFILELSDANGSFVNPTQLAKVADKNTDFDFDMGFALPTDTRGDAYRFRVRSTKPAKISPESDAFEMYYIDYNTSLKIREEGDTASTPAQRVELCDGGTAIVEVYDIPNKETYRYNWYKDTSPYTAAGHGPSITVSEPGYYVVELDYGPTCSGSSNTQSLSIQVIVGSSVGLAINPPVKTAFCAGELVSPLEANMNYPDLFYTWYRDGNIIQASTMGAYSYTIDTNDPQFAGAYTVKVQGNSICTETSAPVAINQTGVFNVTTNNPTNMVLMPGASANLGVSADIAPVTYQWYKDHVAISGATGSTYAATSVGVYYAEVAMSGGGCSSITKKSESITVVHPSSFELTIGYATEYTDCVNTSIVLEVSRIDAVLADGTKTEVTADLISAFSYQWTKDGTAVSGATAKNISLTDLNNNGSYRLTGNLNGFTSGSNTLSVKLLVNETLAIAGDRTIICNAGGTASISTGHDLNGETFRWTKDGADLPFNGPVLEVSEAGSYQLIIDKFGCPLRSNTIEIMPLDENLISLDPDSAEIIFPEGGNRSITASGADSYQWFDADNVRLGDTASITVTLEGSYRLVADLNGCQIIKTFTVSYQDTFGVPNVVTANGDGFNDQWVLPNTYTKDPEINVTVYNHKGEVVFDQFQYQNNWPESSLTFPKQNMIFYYTIKKGNKTLKKGTITVIR